VDQADKDELLSRFRDWLAAAEAGAILDPAADGVGVGEDQEGQDLYSLFVELAGLRTEVRTESRLIKDALDQFRTLVDRLQADRVVMERELERTRAEVRDQARAQVRPILLELLDVRDRLEASLREPAGPAGKPPRRRWWPFGRARKPLPPSPEREAWREGQRMTLRRLDRLLADRRVSQLELAGRPFDPRQAQAVATVEVPGQPSGTVVEVVRAGFLWEGELLRTAEVVVTKSGPA